MTTSRRTPVVLRACMVVFAALVTIAVSIVLIGASPVTVLVGSVLLSATVLDAVFSFGVLRRASIEIDLPGMTRVGDDLPVRLRLVDIARPVLVRVSSLGGDPFLWAEPGTTGVKPVTAPARGRYTGVVVEALAVGPLGLVGWRRRFDRELATPLLVAPQPDRRAFSALPRTTLAAVHARLPERATGLVRGVRDLEAGDGIRHVHWPLSARLGHLVVKEYDVTDPSALWVVLDLLATGEDAEWATRRASGVLHELLTAGRRVQLTTVEAHGVDPRDLGISPSELRRLRMPSVRRVTRTETVGDGHDVDRRLAQATVGTPELDPTARPYLLISSRGIDEWMGG